MTTALPLSIGSIALAELREIQQCDERTLRRQLRKRGIDPDGHRIQLGVLHARWRAMFDTILILREGPAPCCPACGSPTHRACVSCEFTYTPPRRAKAG